MRIRINTERVREVGRRLIAEGQNLAETGRWLNGTVYTLDTWAWDGASRWRAEPLLDRVRPESARLARELEALGRKLLWVAEEFEQEDNTAARNLGGLSWVDFGVAGAGGAGLWGDGGSDSSALWGAGGSLAPGFGVIGGVGIGVVGGALGPWGYDWSNSDAVFNASASLAPGFSVTDWAKERLGPDNVELDWDRFFIGREHKFWPHRRGRPPKNRPSLHLDVAAWEDEVWEEEITGHTYLGGVRLGGKAEAEALEGEAGLGLGWDKGGLLVGGYAAGTVFTAGASGIVGDTDLGLGAGVEVTAGEAEVFAGLHDGRVGAKVGGTLVSAEGTVGANVAGWNVGLTGEIGLKFELGLEVGKKTKAYLGPFTIGLNIGEALGS